MIRKLYFCVGLIILLPSCIKQKVKEQHNDILAEQLNEQKNIILEKVIQQEAMLVSIPIPLYDERILPSSLDCFDKQTILLGYKSSLTIHQLCEFFIGQMERYGWKHIVSFENEETHMIFENPVSYCCIVIKPGINLDSLIFIYVK